MVTNPIHNRIVSFEIYFYDLTEEAQKELAETFKTDPKDENWEILPLAVVDRELEIPVKKF